MLWVFVGIGLVTLASALYGLLAAIQRSKLWIVPHAATLMLLLIAWITSHTTAIGCVSLFLAFFLEVIYRLIGGVPKDLWEPVAPSPEESARDDSPAIENERPAASPDAIDAEQSESTDEAVAQEPLSMPASEESDSGGACEPRPEDSAESDALDEPEPLDTEVPIDNFGEAPSSEPAEPEPISTPEAVAEDVAEPSPEEPPPPETIPAFSTWALLQKPWDASANVFLASLKRGGRRDATLISEGSPTTPITVQIGDLRLQLMAIAEPMNRQALEYGLAQSWDWPEVRAAIKQHVAQVVFTTLAGEGFCREEAVLLHRQAHRAMAEFAQVIAAYWRDAGKLVPTGQATDRDGDIENEPQATDLCITYRVFPLDGGEAGGVLSDTVGLHAFDLPDIQVITHKEPDEHVSALLYQLAQGFFENGCSLKTGARITMPDHTQWQAHREPSYYPPERTVISLTLLAEHESE